MLRHQSNGFAELRVAGESIPEVLHSLEQDFPNLYQSICDETGSIRQHVNLFINEDSYINAKGLKRDSHQAMLSRSCPRFLEVKPWLSVSSFALEQKRGCS